MPVSEPCETLLDALLIEGWSKGVKSRILGGISEQAKGNGRLVHKKSLPIHSVLGNSGDEKHH